ncbi:mechanosensitive ion channel [Pigmentiphaga soli]|uniref:Mechanosensitive ion channel n=1 Tax=Pigmentiphaga soli TaxID=1007095 RepID=A0ABP8H6Y1_9BURK
MTDALHALSDTLLSDSWARMFCGLALLALAAWAVQFVVRRVVTGLLSGLLGRLHRQDWDQALGRRGFYRRLAGMAPFVVVQLGIHLVPELPAAAADTLRSLAVALTVLFGLLTLSAALDAVIDATAGHPQAHVRSAKGYVQLGKIVLWAFGVIVVVAALIDRSPLLLLSGLGAMSAVLLLVFKDTLLSFVASVQLASNDMLRVGDWIEMPQVGADGFVIDVALHTVKVENWDKTITTIPTYRLFAESFRNWRTMFTSGGRRIKRTLRIDAGSVRFLSDEECERLKRFNLLAGYLDNKQKEIADANAGLGEPAGEAVNRRRLTNIGTFRAYVDAYLRNHPGINREMILMVRMLEPGDKGIPIELYCFTASTAWVDYEKVQGDIFDHLLAILPDLGLRLYQLPTGSDLTAALAAR